MLVLACYQCLWEEKENRDFLNGTFFGLKLIKILVTFLVTLNWFLGRPKGRVDVIFLKFL